MYGSTSTPYAGDTSMYQVHKYMGLSDAEFTYFVEQVGLSAASFGVADADVKAAGQALTEAFGYRCAPPAAIPSTAKPDLQAICIAVSSNPSESQSFRRLANTTHRATAPSPQWPPAMRMPPSWNQ